MIFISNFNNSRELSDIKDLFDKYKGTNIDFLLTGFAQGKTYWSVPEKAVLGDTIVFMCAKEARHNIGMATSHIPDNYGDDFKSFVEEEKVLYKKYSGRILGYGIVSSLPKKDEKWWMSNIGYLKEFVNTIHIDEFRSYISISQTNSITYLDDGQWNRLKWTINQKNPGMFPNAVPPDKTILDKEFEDAVKKALSKSIDELKKAALKKSSRSSASTVQTRVYHRDPIIAAYVKKRANGHCQLCGMKAPFADQNGEPYLECHHIDWLSKGGTDSIDNCVALCPNCHRKMHLINDARDVMILKNKVL